MTAAELNNQFSIANALKFEATRGGLVRVVISTPLAEADLYLQGAHVAHWIPRGQKPVLFLSSKSIFAPGKAIRGGIPIVFPWFGARSDGKQGPAHGYARTSDWTIQATRLTENGAIEITLALSAEHGVTVRFAATIGSELGLSLEVSNGGSDPFRYEEALHSYFAVSNVANISVTGLENTTYIDKTDNFLKKQQYNEPIRIAKETDQVHLGTTSACTIHDLDWQRQIVIAKSGSNSTVVWNPWTAKTAGMSDMAPDEWRNMVCVETANAADNALVIAPGDSHTLFAHISVK